MMFGSLCNISATEPEDHMKIGYTDGGMAMKLGMMIPLNMQQAIEFPQTFTQRLNGAKITKIRVAVAGELSEQDNYIFVSEDEMKFTEFDYKQKVEKIEKGWNEITLNEPYVINGDKKLFVGFKIRSTGEVLSMDGRTNNDLGNWVRITEHEDDNESGWQHQDGGNMNIEVFIEGNNLPKNDLAIETLEARNYAPVTGTSPLTLVVKNNASQPIKSADVRILAEGKEIDVRTIDNLNIESGDYGLMNVGSIVFPNRGLNNLSVEIVKVNGVEDEYTEDNKAIKENINCKADYVNRTVLLEHFSTMMCPNCPFAHDKMEAYLPYKVDIVHAVHHSGFGTDPLTTDEGEKYLFFYSDGVQSKIYAPGAMLDRTNLSKYGANDGSASTLGPVFAINRESFNTLVDKQLSTPAYTSVEIEKNFDKATRKLTITVKGAIPTEKALKHIDVDNAYLNIFLTEDSIMGSQKGSENPKEYIHNNVVRNVLTNVWGDAVVYNNREFVSNTYEFVVPEEYDIDKMTIIAFLSKYDSTQPNSCEIYNTAFTTVADAETNGIDNIDGDVSDIDVNINVNNGSLYIYGNYDKAEIYDAAGNHVMNLTGNTFESHINSLGHGLYIIKVHTVNGIKNLKFII